MILATNQCFDNQKGMNKAVKARQFFDKFDCAVCWIIQD